MNAINETIICAGFGGQGIMVMGKVLANAGMKKGLHVTWMPSYGAEVRGGTAHSAVRISTDPVGSPMVPVAGVAIIMNGPSLTKFVDRIDPGGLLILNTSMAEGKVERGDIEVVEAPLTEEAIKMVNVRVANMVAIGIYVARRGILAKDDFMGVIEEMAKGRAELIPINVKALERGIEIGSGS
ncbi:MAG: 2-oxoacid:acceptor oxidoreductase family protein [Candidatus Tantalella remota]|nr:2-oxoacid:acceptor oxidoreductase family protein [Candidatus Tantalella remota]